jgi:membrane protease YdiL (CAAX protease family)
MGDGRVMSPIDSEQRRPSVDAGRRPSRWPLFALACGLSWLFWVPAALLSHGDSSFPLRILTFLGGFGPSVSGIVMVYRSRDDAGQGDFWRRVFSFRRIGGAWYAFILLVFPLVTGLSVLVEVVGGRGVPFFPYLAALGARPLLVMAYLPVIILQVALLGPLSEELGWRGYALDVFQARWGALASSLVVGLAWAVCHAPLFFVRTAGNFYHE